MSEIECTLVYVYILFEILRSATVKITLILLCLFDALDFNQKRNVEKLRENNKQKRLWKKQSGERKKTHF